MVSKEDGHTRLSETEKLAGWFVSKYSAGADVPREAFAEGPEPLTDATTPRLRRHLLRNLGVVETTVGHGGPATRLADADAMSKRVVEAARAVWELLSSDGRVAPEQLRDKAKDRALEAEDGARRVAEVLKTLGLAQGVQKVGGLRRIDVAEEEARKAEADAEAAGGTPEEKERRKESYYYQFFAEFVGAWDGSYDAGVVGGSQVFDGEWSTPDILAVSVQTSPSLIVPIVRLVSVEVKLLLSRAAIAQAASHCRFAHYAYLGTPQAPVEIGTTLLTDLAHAGVGLICPRQRGSMTFHVYVDARLCRPDEEEVEALLAQWKLGDGTRMSKKVSGRVKAAMG